MHSPRLLSPPLCAILPTPLLQLVRDSHPINTPVQRIVRERFGARGRALGLAPGIPSEGFSAATDAQKAADQLLADVYVYLVKECNKVRAPHVQQ
jgi:hypothetical protein